ncbi:tetratricopeptide repeat protein [Psychromonas sp.]|uniref:tetratricopeptide repeat protein n=1 Tax=Psychromonas sp. TaxID=1884585 RepID=UPI00356462E4
MNYIKKITLFSLPWLLVACGTIPTTRPVQETKPPVVTVPQPKPKPVPQQPVIKPQEAPVSSVAKAPSAVVALLQRAEQQEREGNNRAAVSSLERAIRIAPRYPESYYRLGELRYKEGSYSQAASLAQKTLSLGAEGMLRSLAKALIEKANAH